MAYRKSTLRKMDTNTRKLAHLINDLDSALTRLKNFMPTVERMELESNALYSRLSTYEKKVFDQEQLATQPISEPVSLFPEQHEQVQSGTLAEPTLEQIIPNVLKFELEKQSEEHKQEAGA